MSQVTIRRGTAADSEAIFPIFLRAILDLGERLGLDTITGGAGAASDPALWQRRRPLFDHLAATADLFLLAESAGRPVGYARSTKRGDLRELTEFFVLPGEQSRGCGRMLLERALPAEAGVRRCLIATPDTRALVLYLRAGLSARFPIGYLARSPRRLAPPDGMELTPLSGSAADLAALAGVDAVALGHRRDEDHRWLASQRRGFLARRSGRLLGYGYAGEHSGPFAALDPADMPALLACAEGLAAAASAAEFGVDVPLVNRSAVAWLLDNHYRLDRFVTQFMSDEPFGSFDRYIVTTPSFFL